MVKRRIEAVARGHTSFENRFPGKRRRIDDGLPPLAPWRSNLTALSHTSNLYFIAYGARIYVYQPEYPQQCVRDPVLIIESQPSDPELRGYLDADEPHAINNLLVQKLGREEVIATVRDDGDVEALLTRHVVHAIAERTREGTAPNVIADVKPIFQRNVGISAWGLAIHTQARIIAVSSNKHEVTVFRFALVEEPETPRAAWRRNRDPATLETCDDQEHVQSLQPKTERLDDVTRQVVNGQANIPHIAFCNTGDDPKARWLITTDISGVCRTIDLDSFALAQAFRFGPSFASSAMHGGYDRLNAGWGIMFLDMRSFLPEDSVDDALGIEHGEVLPDLKSDARIWDSSKTLRHVPDHSEAFSEPKPPRLQQRLAQSRSVSGRHSVSSPVRAPDSIDTSSAIEETLNQEEEGGEGGVPLTDSGGSEHAAAPEDTPAITSSQASEDDSPGSTIEFWDDLDVSDSEPTEDSISASTFYNGERVCGNIPQFVRNTGICEDLPCPILHASVRNIYLLQPSKHHAAASTFSPPLVGLAAPLKQSIQAEYRGLNMFDRLNMHAYIPTLGVVILASQKGRAIVLSLTKVSRSVKYPPEMHDIGTKTNYAMRVECVLPYESEEKSGKRPFSPLHGITVGPIQGTYGMPEARKRWRLMMMYQDHSILSYEIQSRREEQTSLDDVVV